MAIPRSILLRNARTLRTASRSYRSKSWQRHPGRRGYASEQGGGKQGTTMLASDLPWAIGAVAATIPGVYMVVKGKDLSNPFSHPMPGDHYHGEDDDEHGGDEEGEGEEEEQDGEQGGEEGEDKEAEEKEDGGEQDTAAGVAEAAKAQTGADEKSNEGKSSSSEGKAGGEKASDENSKDSAGDSKSSDGDASDEKSSK